MLSRITRRSSPSTSKSYLACPSLTCFPFLQHLPQSLIQAPSKTTTLARQYARPAPSIRRTRNTPGRGWKPGVDNLQYNDIMRRVIGGVLDKLYKLGAIRATGKQALAFLTDFKSLMDKVEGRRPTVDLESFKSTQSKHFTDDEDCLIIAQQMQKIPDDTGFFDDLWQYLTRTLSHSGYVPATLWVVGSIWKSAQKNESLLHSVTAREPLQRLEEIAGLEDGDYRAKTLLGNIEHLRGNETRAIRLWTDAVRAVEDSAKLTQTSIKDRIYGRVKQLLDAISGARKERSDDVRLSGRLKDELHVRPRAQLIGFQDPFQLESPWIELALIHQERSRRGFDEAKACEEALDAGCRLDDPLSHYYKALHTKAMDAEGDHLATSTWLYHITKAAVSGHAGAMFELGVFYSESGWKYIEDEPPDHVKPTAFDSYPPAAAPSFIDRIGQVLGLKSIPQTSVEEDVFRTAINPSDETGRFMVGSRWCFLALKNGYAPAALYAAKMHLEKTRWAAASAPESAVRLQDTRHSYASREDFETKKPRSDLLRVHEEPQDKENVHYSITSAASALTCVFRAFEASNLRKDYYRKASADRFRVTGSLEAQKYFSSRPWHYRLWWLNLEVLDSYEDKLEQMKAEAEQICEEHRLVLIDSNGDVLYQTKPGREGRNIIRAATPSKEDHRRR